MGGFVTFIIVLIVIWTLSGVATWVNKQKEAERRRMLRQQLGQPPRAGLPTSMRQPPRAGPRPPARRISPGIADRFPDVLLPPAPQPPMRKPVVRQAPPRQQPMRLPAQPRPVAKRPKARPVPQLPLPPMLSEAEVVRPLVEPAPAPPTARQTAADSPRIGAQTLSRWLKPQTLNQQFLLTEIFQPPLALRDRHL